MLNLFSSGIGVTPFCVSGELGGRSSRSNSRMSLASQATFCHPQGASSPLAPSPSPSPSPAPAIPSPPFPGLFLPEHFSRPVAVIRAGGVEGGEEEKEKRRGRREGEGEGREGEVKRRRREGEEGEGEGRGWEVKERRRGGGMRWLEAGRSEVRCMHSERMLGKAGEEETAVGVGKV
eukprot:528483-Hanusia_phi.AAC.5